MKTDARRRCACPCDCDSSAAGERCYLCGQGTHRAPRGVRTRLERRLELWTAVMASYTPGSSLGISLAALAEARRVFEVRWRAHESQQRAQT